MILRSKTVDVILAPQAQEQRVSEENGVERAVLAACISERAQQMRRSLDSAVPAPQSLDALTTTLVEFGVSLLETFLFGDLSLSAAKKVCVLLAPALSASDRIHCEKQRTN